MRISVSVLVLILTLTFGNALLGFAMGGRDAVSGAAVPENQVEIVTAQGAHRIFIELADDPEERAQGLMYRETMPLNAGMLFDFGASREVSMWMKNTPLPLDMFFIRRDGTIARIAESTEPYSTRSIPSGERVLAVLEVNVGIARRFGAQPGDIVRHRIFNNHRNDGL